VRERNIECTHEKCNRKFAFNKEMYRHVRNDHALGPNPNTQNSKYSICPEPGCTKSFKTLGWLEKHVKECHPDIDPKTTVAGTSETSAQKTKWPKRKRSEPQNKSIEGYSCPVGKCNKRLPTWKSITNHCYRDHSFSVSTGKLMARKKKGGRTAPMPRELGQDIGRECIFCTSPR
jgi:hypothetical protein